MATGFPVKANYATGDVLTATNMNDLSGTVNYLQYMTPRNSVLNSNFSVWQRGTSIAYATGLQYTTDRYILYRGGSTATTISRQATGDTTNLPNIQYCARVQRNAGDTTTNAIYLSYSQETINSVPLAGKTITFSYYARKGANFSEAGSNLSLVFNTGTGTDQVINNGYTGSVSAISTAVTLTTTWQRFTHTATLPSTATELGFYFYYTPSGTAGANDYFEITGIQLEQGSVANTYMPNQPTYQGELAACQRYYYRATASSAYGLVSNAACARTTTTVDISQAFPVTMRTNPSSVDFANIAYRNGNGGGLIAITAVTLDSGASPNAGFCNATVTGATAGQFGVVYGNNNAAGYLGFNAEL